MYSLQSNTWSRIYTCRHVTNNNYDLDIDSLYTGVEPCPRYAHQLIYDDVAKVKAFYSTFIKNLVCTNFFQMHYLFGGNPGKSMLPQLRLDDLWILTLEK